jgi:hypothetical protein
MQSATAPQITKLHALLNNLGFLDQKASIILNFTDGRTQSSKQLTIDEARRLITNLAEYDPNERLRSVIFSLAYQAGIIYGSSADDKRMNTAKLNLFLKERGAVKLELNQMHYRDLIKVHRQFEAIVKNVNQAKDKKSADTAVKHLLGEFNLSVQ